MSQLDLKRPVGQTASVHFVALTPRLTNLLDPDFVGDSPISAANRSVRGQIKRRGGIFGGMFQFLKRKIEDLCGLQSMICTTPSRQNKPCQLAQSSCQALRAPYHAGFFCFCAPDCRHRH